MRPATSSLPRSRSGGSRPTPRRVDAGKLLCGSIRRDAGCKARSRRTRRIGCFNCWALAGQEAVTKAVRKLAGEQREDGGWAQLPTLASDAYATGLALYALHEGGGVAVDHPAYRRGVEFLLRTQLADGSWFVASRSFPIVNYSNSGFPHGRSQFISAAATCWATMALTLTTPSPPE